MVSKMQTGLTTRERNILILSAKNIDGKCPSNADIAQLLSISVSIVKAAIHRACIKLGVKSRADLFVMASKKGEINACDLIPPGRFISAITAMGARNVEELAKVLAQKLERKAIQISN